MSRGRQDGRLLTVVLCHFSRWGATVKDQVEVTIVEPPLPFESCQFRLLGGTPRTVFLDQFLRQQGKLSFGDVSVVNLPL